MDIDINEEKLENLIKTLEEDNKKMIETIDSLYDKFLKIDKNDWDSPEKNRLDKGFIPYLKRQSESINIELNNKTNFLKRALITYKIRNQKLKKDAQNLEDLK